MKGSNGSTLFRKCILKSTGFTLLEVIIAVSILTVGLLGVASMQISTIRGNNFSDNTTLALNLAQEKMEDLLGKPYMDNDLKDTNTENSNKLDSITDVDFTEQINNIGKITEKGYFRRIWNISDNNPITNNKSITITVTWDSDRHKVSLSSIKRM